MNQTSTDHFDLKRCIPHSKEAKLAKSGRISYKEALMNTFHRRMAYASARPYSALIIGEGSELLYREGFLTYLRDGFVHIVNVHGVSGVELVIDLHSALGLPADGEHHFQLMHYQDSVLSVLHTLKSPGNSEGHLVVFDTRMRLAIGQERILLYVRLPTGYKEFVRHDSRNLIYGTYVGTDDSEDDMWRFWAFSLVQGSAGIKAFSPGRFSTGDIGSNILFEILDGYFYIVTSQITLDAEGRDPTSFYGGCRYPLFEHTHGAQLWRLWRRQQREGPIHDLWTDFALQQDEGGHGLLIHESRREWQDGFRKQKRTFYTEPLDLNAMAEFSMLFEDFIEAKKPAAGSSNPNTDDGDSTIESLMSEASRHILPEWASPHKRLSRYCHPEYNDKFPSGSSEFSLANTKYRAYNHSSFSFLDIVIDDRPPSRCPSLRKHLRLRVGSRRLASPLGEDGLIICLPGDNERYSDKGIQLWPPLDAPQELFELLNSEPSISKLKAASDERSVVYMPASGNSRQTVPIVLINFDPAIRYPGLKELSIRQTKDTNANTQSASNTSSRVENLTQESNQSVLAYSGELSYHENALPWARVQRAAWLDKAVGFQF